jgi:hypothetical protein
MEEVWAFEHTIECSVPAEFAFNFGLTSRSGRHREIHLDI